MLYKAGYVTLFMELLQSPLHLLLVIHPHPDFYLVMLEYSKTNLETSNRR